MCAQCEWMSKHGLAQANCKNPRQRVLHNLRLFQQNTPVPQQGWFTDKLRISTKRHRRRATHIKSRLILSDIHQKATIKSFWWMSDVKKGEKGKHHWQCKTKSGFCLSTCKCITSDRFPKVSFQWFEMLFTCGWKATTHKHKYICWNTHVYMELCVRVSISSLSSHSRIGRTLLKLIFRDL